MKMLLAFLATRLGARIKDFHPQKCAINVFFKNEIMKVSNQVSFKCFLTETT